MNGEKDNRKMHSMKTSRIFLCHTLQFNQMIPTTTLVREMMKTNIFIYSPGHSAHCAEADHSKAGDSIQCNSLFSLSLSRFPVEWRIDSFGRFVCFCSPFLEFNVHKSTKIITNKWYTLRFLRSNPFYVCPFLIVMWLLCRRFFFCSGVWMRQTFSLRFEIEFFFRVSNWLSGTATS